MAPGTDADPAAVVAPGRLRLDHQEEDARSPVLATTPRPRLTWQRSRDPVPAERIRVELLDASGSAVWSAVLPPESLHAEPPFDLPPYGAFRWRVRSERNGKVSAWGELAFETGPWSLADWHASWLEVPAGAIIRTGFRARAASLARLYLTGQGVVVARLNGAPVNADRLDPSRTDIGRALYRVFDVGELLVDGRNELDLIVGRGGWHATALLPRVLVQLRIVAPGAAARWVAPDEDAVLVPSEVEADDPFYLERTRAGGGTAPGAPIRRLEAAEATTDAAVPPRRVDPDGSPPVRAQAALTPVEVGRVDGARQFDVGLNIAGRSRVVLESRVPPGTTVTVVHGEHLDERGRIDTTNLTMPYDHGRERQVLTRVCGGRPGEAVEPLFAYHGFRYLEVRGLPDDARIHVTARPFHSELRTRGRVDTDNELIGRLLERAERTALNNVHGVPEDCPTREQAAWTGDMASAADFHFAQFDHAAFAPKWLGDLVTSQGTEGDIPGIAPHVGPAETPADPVWGAALHRVLWNHWLHVGDERVVDAFLPAVRRWGRYQLGRIGSAGIADGFPISYGQDWLALEQTPAELIHSGAVIDSLETLALLEEAAGDPEAAVDWRGHAERLRLRTRQAFLETDGGSGTVSIANGSQGSLAVALESGMLSEGESARAAAQLAELVRERGNRVSSGFALTRSVVRSLAEHGYSAVLLDCLAQPAEPGIGAMLAAGPGTFWENWWIDPRNTGTGSLDHVGLGAPFAAWVWEHVIGVRPTDRGYRRFEVRPAVLFGITRVNATFETPAGAVAVRYRRTGAGFVLELEVPPGSVAVVSLPGRDPIEAGPGRHELTGDALPVPEAVPAPELPRWSAPALAPEPNDERDGLRLDAGARWEPGRGEPAWESADLVCMPVPHAQFGHAVTQVTATEAGEEASIVLRLPEPLPLRGAGFLHAAFDLCSRADAAGARLVLAAHLADGSRRRVETRSWPASWNRVTLDLAGITGALIAVEVGVRAPAMRPLSGSGDGPVSGWPAFHLGEVGLSPRRARW
ncbi:alpha-L-rhamnosidase [Pseudolysinimonas kribbensis]|uniref:alpha-L-rhamnosidase n=1 Tax=Pseudolysinimonas kribbensis TaxID=433641 RepID=A0ABQ6KCC3_9MICO|nr:family 78 glycoside hydrolase catalytic domain [Pseudolysinimonas kribbensis]GMA96849.1 alpha-L-rhamnosidase [Pseudolysinimonas kribbensis]